MSFLLELIKKILRQRHKRRRLYRTLTALAGVVVFVTTYAMMLPAITIDRQTALNTPGMNWTTVAEGEMTAGLSTTGEAASEEEATAGEICGAEADDAEAKEIAQEGSETSQEDSAADNYEAEDVIDEGTDTEEDGSASSTGQQAGAGEEQDSDDSNDAASDSDDDAQESENTDSDVDADAEGTDETLLSAEELEGTNAAAEMITEDTELTFEGSNYNVYVTVTPEAMLQKGTELQVREITPEVDEEEYLRYFDKAQEELLDKYEDNPSLSFARFYDISFVSDGVQIEPASNVTVRIEYKKAVEMEANASVDTVHFAEQKAEEGEAGAFEGAEQTDAQKTAPATSTAIDAENIVSEFITSEVKTADGQTIRTQGDENGREKTSAANLAGSTATPEVKDAGSSTATPEVEEGAGTIQVTEIKFESNQFSVYGIVGTTIEKTVLASDGKNYKITVNYGDDAEIPAGAELKVEELVDGDEQYDEYAAGTAEAVGSQVELLTHLRIFDIRIVDADGHKIEPKAPVEVRIEYDDPVEIAGEQEIEVVHFGEEKTEVIAPETNRGEDGKVDEFVFEAESFSYYSIVSQENPKLAELDGKTYVLITPGDVMLLGKKLSEEYPDRLAGVWCDPEAGKVISNRDTYSWWTFEAVDGRDGWYYISDGNGNYLNLNEKSLTLGEKQAIYVGTRPAGDNTQYQLRNQEEQNGAYAVNNYGHTWRNGFAGWPAGEGSNEWFQFFDIEYLGEIAISFDKNGGSSDAPATMYGIEGNTIILPDYTGTKEGYTFIGWSTGNNLVKNTYYPLYPAGSEYTVPSKNTTLYAVWTHENPVTAEFYIRLDGTIPYEPDQYNASAYTKKITIKEAIKNEVWVTDNDATKPNNGVNVLNDVTDNLNKVPTVDQLVANINDSHKNIGFKVANQNGELVVTKITYPGVNAQNYNVKEGDALYVLWYVQKYAGGWHVDGVLLSKDKVKIAYDGNATDGTVKNVPLGYQETKGTSVTIGASGSKSGTVKTPTRPGYNFLGWNTAQDGSGIWYYNNDTYTLNEDTTLYAQWSKGTNMMTVFKQNPDGEALAGAKFKLEEKTSDGSFIEKAVRTTGEAGIFTYDSMENDTLYRMTETYAPNGYEVQNSFFFKVCVDGTGSEVLAIHVCDENGSFIDKPSWLTITYTPAESSSASGVARIRFDIEDERIERSITFVKTDFDGNPLAGAVYTLTDAKEQAVTGVLKDASDANGIFSVDGATLTYGTYTLTETTPPATYKQHGPVVFTLNDYVSAEETGLTITSGNEYATADCVVSSQTIDGLKITTYSYTITVKDEQETALLLKKVGYNNVDGSTWPLQGATFKIYADEGKQTTASIGGQSELTSDENGVLYNGYATPGTYYLDETVVPDGYYAPTGMYILEVTESDISLRSTSAIGSPDLSEWITTDQNTQQTVYTVSIRNTMGVKLPSTGGPGTWLFTGVGGILTAAAGLLLLRRTLRISTPEVETHLKPEIWLK